MAKCKQCGKEYNPLSVNQKYCCTKCGEMYRRNRHMDEEYPSITFQCSHCGKTVVTEAGVCDKRTRFCCASCEKKFWRHPHWEHKNSSQNVSAWRLQLREKSCD